MRALALVLVALVMLGACGKKSSPPKTHDDAAITAPSSRPAPALPPVDEPTATPDAALIATHVTPSPSTEFGHFCVKTDSGRSKCVTTEEECKKLAPRCGQWKSVFCFKLPTGPVCFSSPEDCKAARAEAVKAGEQVTTACAQDEM